MKAGAGIFPEQTRQNRLTGPSSFAPFHEPFSGEKEMTFTRTCRGCCSVTPRGAGGWRRRALGILPPGAAPLPQQNPAGLSPSAHGQGAPGQKLRVQGEGQGEVNFTAELWHLVGRSGQRGSVSSVGRPEVAVPPHPGPESSPVDQTPEASPGGILSHQALA